MEDETVPTFEESTTPEVPQEVSESVSVINASGDVVRVYSTADHGANFRELAAQFAIKVGGSLR